ncbi:uncharacterized protein LOC124357762 [Homalodisca vitripennis]|uniref:uncharacterized protein LOC124357762 n=1 Tax=Homalodisca vitripennis TaxID=197043 RepID=UPI001EEA8895|nr:uncharacterized protein LOC124357762 [Homalodisca vitripennis]
MGVRNKKYCSFQMPENEEQWLCESKKFEEKWDFPHAVGAIDGKHVAIQCPPKSGSEYFNYKSFFSFVLFALVDADYNFMFVDVGCQSRISDGGVFKNSQLYDNIEKGNLKLPPPSPLPNSSIPSPYVILGDDAFALSDSLMKPYSGYHPQGSPERIYNYRLSRARRVVENAFGILASVFRVLRKPLLLETENAKWVVMACVYLHNFLRRSASSSRLYCPVGALDTEENGEVTPGTWRNEVAPASLLGLKKVPRRSNSTAKDIREAFATYFMTNGAVSWQNDYA